MRSREKTVGYSWLRSPSLVVLCVLVSVCAILYASYRAYYALGGTVGMFGQPASMSQWRAVNAFGAIAISLAAIVPLAALPLSRWPQARLVLLVLFSLAAVGLVMHGLIDEGQRALSLSGLASRWHLALPALSTTGWIQKDQRTADLQDVFLNEPWFLVEGLLCGAIVWRALGPGAVRRRWLAGAIAAVLALTAYGMLSSVGLVGRTIVF